ncbi:tyrosine-protein kinase [Wenyingzhuangia sp. 2_MG-2023]|uniref:GumC family protein n=1 Tax=Wenyingzhuangia sp. 2_MG-2023 TaxID=3062639 RepID=UPI0026E33051|nr:tyrosine-protein kinase [Wenyingzhuangia sp. 2_MG-2023]MDO6739321.1 polysaccharide biosynthesis tyrosine autokinase [Wenyingzhuangia sp. 2_MG-2023]
MSHNTNSEYSREVSQSINLRAELEKYLMHWKWFFLSIILAGAVAVFLVKTKVNIYETKASVLVKEDGGASTDLKMFQDLSSLGLSSSSNVYDEVEVLKSRSLAFAYVKKLNLNFEIYQKKGLKEIELYKESSPIKYQVLSDKEDFYQLDTFMDVTILDNFQFKYQAEESEEEITVKFGEKISFGKHVFLITPFKSDLKNKKGEKYRVVFKKIDNVVENYKKKVEVNSIDQNSNIIELNLKHANKSKSRDILNTMVDLYNQMSIDDQNLVGEKTDKFITKRLEVIKEELDEVDRNEELYKSDKQITDIALQSQVFVDAKSVNEQEIFKKESELRLVEFMIEDIQKEKEDFELLPTSIGITEAPQLSLSVNNYNELLFERNRLLRNSSMSNPVVQNLNMELKNSIDNIKGSLIGTKRQLEISLKSLNSVEKQFENKISALPKQVREYRGILRRQSIIAELYSYLLQKKEENEISMAVTVSNSKVIDRAYSLSLPIAPKKKVIVLAGLMIGLLVPFSFIYLRDLLDTKFKSRRDLEEALTAPLLGDIPFDKSGEKIVVRKGSRTSTAEAFRLLRTNLDFMLASVESKSKSIFVTSTISGEGKTFVAVNVAASIALTGKKVVLIGMDLRAPKITQYLDLPNRKGVSNYLIDKNILLEDMVSPLEGFDNLYLLSSGVVPPNPAELLLSSRIEDLFAELKKSFDYVVVDTAPVNLVTDTLMISKYADMVLYTARSNYLDKRFLEVPERLYNEKRLPNMAVLLNGLDYTRGYGYGYGGYGYPKENEHKNIFQKIFKK